MSLKRIYKMEFDPNSAKLAFKQSGPLRIIMLKINLILQTIFPLKEVFQYKKKIETFIWDYVLFLIRYRIKEDIGMFSRGHCNKKMLFSFSVIDLLLSVNPSRVHVRALCVVSRIWISIKIFHYTFIFFHPHVVCKRNCDWSKSNVVVWVRKNSGNLFYFHRNYFCYRALILSKSW